MMHNAMVFGMGFGAAFVLRFVLSIPAAVRQFRAQQAQIASIARENLSRDPLRREPPTTGG